MGTKMNFKEIKEKINRSKKSGDIARAGRASNLTDSTYHNAMKKDEWNELTVAQQEYVEAMLKILENRAVKAGNVMETAEAV